MSVNSQDLENFIVACQPKLDDIRASLNAFNIFNVLGVQHREIRHSNFLGWLFDPNESHQLGDVFLKDLFKLIRLVDPKLDAAKLVNLLLEDLSATEVYRETKNDIDILIVNHEHDILICIENKINASFSKKQLGKYYQFIEDNYDGITTRIYLTLTPKATNTYKLLDYGEHYHNINYQQVIDIIIQNKHLINQTHTTVKESINQYLAMTQKSITASSPEIKLAQEIYRKYKNEIDFISKSQPNFRDFKNDLLSLLEGNHIEGFGKNYTSNSTRIIGMLPLDEELRAIFRKPEFGSWNSEYMFSIEIFIEKTEIYLKWVFGSVKNNQTELQEIKTDFYKKMSKFESFKNREVKNGKVLNSSPDANFPGVYRVTLFDDIDFLESNLSLTDLFIERLKFVNKQVINPWIIECKENLM